MRLPAPTPQSVRFNAEPELPLPGWDQQPRASRRAGPSSGLTRRVAPLISVTLSLGSQKQDRADWVPSRGQATPGEGQRPELGSSDSRLGQAECPALGTWRGSWRGWRRGAGGGGGSLVPDGALGWAPIWEFWSPRGADGTVTISTLWDSRCSLSQLLSPKPGLHEVTERFLVAPQGGLSCGASAVLRPRGVRPGSLRVSAACCPMTWSVGTSWSSPRVASWCLRQRDRGPLARTAGRKVWRARPKCSG